MISFSILTFRRLAVTPLTRSAVALTVTLVTTVTLPAADVDANIPGDTEIVLSVNLQQLLGSPLGKKYLRTTIEESIKANAQAQEAVEFVELDALAETTGI